MIIRTLHIILAFAVLFSTMGVSVNRHYCRNEVKHVSLFVKANGCGKSEHKGCHAGGHCQQHPKKGKRNCCHDKSEYFKIDQDKQIQVQDFIPLKIPACYAYVEPVFNLLASCVEPGFSAYLRYKPPIRCEDFQVLLQVFRL